MVECSPDQGDINKVPPDPIVWVNVLPQCDPSPARATLEAPADVVDGVNALVLASTSIIDGVGDIYLVWATAHALVVGRGGDHRSIGAVDGDGLAGAFEEAWVDSDEHAVILVYLATCSIGAEDVSDRGHVPVVCGPLVRRCRGHEGQDGHGDEG